MAASVLSGRGQVQDTRLAKTCISARDERIVTYAGSRRYLGAVRIGVSTAQLFAEAAGGVSVSDPRSRTRMRPRSRAGRKTAFFRQDAPNVGARIFQVSIGTPPGLPRCRLRRRNPTRTNCRRAGANPGSSQTSESLVSLTCGHLADEKVLN